MAATSSWHPAFMPNSAPDANSTAQYREPSYTITSGNNVDSPEHVSNDRLSPDTESIPSHGERQAGDHEQLRSTTPTQKPVPLPVDNSAHPELENLRDALATSLASPGGVELEERPLHHSQANVDITQEEKANFPTESPAPNKHSSSVSFARTVSEDVTWAEEEDDVDPTWNIQQTENDPFRDMAKSDRTNSFPIVPPVHSQASFPEPLLSEVQEILKEDEQVPNDLFGDDDGGEDAFFRNPALEVEQAEKGSESQFGPAYGGGISQESENDLGARYEEGLPLVDSQADGAEVPSASLTFDDEMGEDLDFFAQNSKSSRSVQDFPHGLERKSTVQVMSSIKYQTYEETHDDVPEFSEQENQQENQQSSLQNTSGGDIATSKSTIVSQVLGELQSAIPESGETEEDIAAKWKAALAEDEFLDDDDDLLPDDEPAQEGKVLDPATLFEDDDEGFLDDPLDNIGSIIAPVVGNNGQAIGFDSLTGPGQLNRMSNNRTQSSTNNNRYLPTGVTSGTPPAVNPYAPSAPQFTDLSRPTAGLSAPPSYGPLVPSFPVPQPQLKRPELPKAQSFANQSKGGYSSPYDLPMDVVKPRKPRAQASMQQIKPQQKVPPPRASSMNPLPSSRNAGFGLSPPHDKDAFQPNAQPPAALPKPGPPSLKSKGSFFEDLPISTRPKVAPRYSHSPALQGPQTPTDGGPQQFQPPNAYTSPQPQPPTPAQGLVAPDRVSPYASLPNTIAPPTLPSTSRYSPAPPNVQGQTAPPPPIAQSRYSPAPAPSSRQASYSNPPGSSNPVLAHQPRTSSPLAHFSQGQNGNLDRRSSSAYEPSLRASLLSPTREADEGMDFNGANHSQSSVSNYLPESRLTQTPPPAGPSASSLTSPPKRTSYLPQQSRPIPQAIVPPRRSQTQSPGAAYGAGAGLNNAPVLQRPASVEVPGSPTAHNAPSVPVARNTRPRGFSHGLNYMAPTDGREHDPMQRWKGSPIFVWGVGGTVATSFPKDVPRYGRNQTMPMMIRSPGEVKIRGIKDIDPLPDRLTSFPGPLKGKSKKKEVVSWLASGIQILEQEAKYLQNLASLTHEDKRVEERILLWKILQVFIDNDGLLEGNHVVNKAVRAVLSPGLDDEQSSGNTPLYATGADLSGISHSASATPRADPVDPAAVEQLRKHLLRGDREKAVWDAVDKRLWAHAILISNTVSRELYKQVCQEFVQKEVKNIGDNTESLAALYEIFAGNLEESIDELVPPSARAGFQMVSTSGSGEPSKDALVGLDRWRETLGLVLSNRSTEDNQALNALGKLLSGYGRAEAAHICFLFARSHSVFGGIDDPASSMVLVGSDHLRQPHEFDREMEPILLSEVFEYGMSLSNTSNLAVSSPHLSIYKLQHALILAEYGFREKALEYCDAISASIHAQTRKSPYHHAQLEAGVDDLSKRLKQSPKDGKSSWISKPSVDKVSSTVWSTFNKFVAGEDSESGTPASASNGESGPFARIGGSTPTISRSPSNSEFPSYSSGLGINGSSLPNAKTSRYAPVSYEPQAATSYGSLPSQGSQPRSSYEGGRSSGEYRRNQYEPVRQDSSDYRPASQQGNVQNSYTPQSSFGYTPQAASNSPYGSSFSESNMQYINQPPTQGSPQLAPSPYSPYQNGFNGLQPAPTPHTKPYEPVQSLSHDHESINEEPQDIARNEPLASAHGDANSGYEPPTSYDPPATFQPYEPSSYVPYAEEPDSPIDTKPKKKQFMDDDEDEFKATPPPASSEKTKAEKDREADEAFRKAAEADAARAKDSAPSKKGWGLGGWFGGGAKKEADIGAQPTKAIRAKLGEESSFIYDPDLKRWVNKKGGADGTHTPSATPPPPRAAGPPRTASGPPMGAATSAPRLPSAPQRAATEGPSGDAASASAPPSASGLAAPSALAMSRSISNGSAASGPPSRPGTSMSNASSIDDLLGSAMGPRKAGALKPKKKAKRYVDVMGDQADKGAA